jgi:hypothetical protein
LKLKRLKKLKRKKGFFQNPDVELFCKKWAAEVVPLVGVGREVMLRFASF